MRNYLNPLRACLATAVAEGLIRHNPTLRVSLPHRPVIDELETEEVRAFSREELAGLLDVAHPRYRLLFASWRRRACGSPRRSPSSGATSRLTARART